MRDLEIGEHILIEDYRSVVVWQGCVTRAGGNLLVVAGDQPPPVDLKSNAPVRVCFSEERWLTKVRGRVLEREDRVVKILLVGAAERIQRRGHIRVSVSEQVEVSIARAESEPLIVPAEVVDVSEGGFQLRSATPFSLGDMVQLQCNLNGAGVRLCGQVVRVWPGSDGHNAGVRATALPPAARGAISSFVIGRSLAARRKDAVGSRRTAEQ
jgi:hypothetical protein